MIATLTDTPNTWIVIEDDGTETRVVTKAGATAEQAIAVLIESRAPPPIMAWQVRAEASRRMQVLVGARNADHLSLKIANAQREATRLLLVKTDRPWTPDEAARAAELAEIDAAIEAIRAASNAMEAVPPADYADDRHWGRP